MLVPGAVDEINDKKNRDVSIEFLQDNNNGNGWSPNQTNDYVDIKLVHGVEMTQIKVLKGSNVKRFELWYENIDEDLFKNKVYSQFFYLIVKSINNNLRIVFHLKKTFQAEPIIYVFPKNLEEIRTVRFIPTEKLNKKLPYNIKLKIEACIGKFLNVLVKNY